MNKFRIGLFFLTLCTLAACVTINVYFPAAAAERAAEKFVDDVIGEPDRDSSYRLPLDFPGEALLLASAGVLDWLVPSAQAQEAEIDINTPQINAIKARMAQRHREELAPLYESGAIGFTSDGLVAIRDPAAVPLSERRKLEGLVAAENRDRRAVYREIAVANGHPEWEEDIQQTFAEQWLQNARKGWYFQDADGDWRQK